MNICEKYGLALLVVCAGFLFSGCGPNENEDENPFSEEEQESAEVRPEVIFAVADDQPLYQYIESQDRGEHEIGWAFLPKNSYIIKSTSFGCPKYFLNGRGLFAFEYRIFIGF